MLNVLSFSVSPCDSSKQPDPYKNCVLYIMNLPSSKIGSTYCYGQLAFLIVDDEAFISGPFLFSICCITNALSVIYMQIFGMLVMSNNVHLYNLCSVNRCFDFTNKQCIFHHATSVIVFRVVKWSNIRLRGYLV